MDTSGFYKISEGELLYAPNAVYNKDYELLRDNHTNYTYPVDGWTWFDSREEACIAFGYEDNTETEEPLIII